MEGYKIAMIANVDRHVMENDNPTLDRGDFMRMVCNTLDSKMEQVWRVKFLDDGSVAMYSFAMPPQKNLPNPECLNAASLPDWIKERLAVLQICQTGDVVEGVGQKLSDQVFYVIE